MFTTIYNCFINYFLKRNDIEDEETWTNKKLNEWKVNLLSSNTYLYYVPNERILEKKTELRKQYKELKN